MRDVLDRVTVEAVPAKVNSHRPRFNRGNWSEHKNVVAATDGKGVAELYACVIIADLGWLNE